MWAPVLRRLSEKLNKTICLYSRPRLTDLFARVPFERSSTRADSLIFQNLPYCAFNEIVQKSSAQKRVDGWFELFLRLLGLQRFYDTIWYRRSRAPHFQFVYLDLWQHSYAKQEFQDRYLWKTPGHIIDIIGESVGLLHLPHQCEIILTSEEDEKAKSIIGQYGLGQRFVTIEPCTNKDYFGNLRAWPHERWQAVVDAIRARSPEMTVVQVGLAGSESLKGVLNLCGKMTFRETVALIGKGRLFLGTEGGVMHAANAVKAEAIILWGGVTLPEFAGYPEKHHIICSRVSCAPCGHKGFCDEGHKCMNDIGTNKVVSVVMNVLGC